jgi:hypothetical protein
MTQPRRTLTLTDEQREALQQTRDQDRREYVRERCAALLKVAAGRSPYWVAKYGLLKERGPDAIYTWLDYYAAEGLSGLLAHQQGGPRRRRV